MVEERTLEQFEYTYFQSDHPYEPSVPHRVSGSHGKQELRPNLVAKGDSSTPATLSRLQQLRGECRNKNLTSRFGVRSDTELRELHQWTRQL